MEKINEIIDKRNLYSFSILLKLYLSSNGKVNCPYNGSLRKEIIELFGEKFDEAYYKTAINWLTDKEYTQGRTPNRLTGYGRDYLENKIKELSSLNEDEKKDLDKAISEKLKSFLGLTKDVLTTINTGKNLMLYLLEITN